MGGVAGLGFGGWWVGMVGTPLVGVGALDLVVGFDEGLELLDRMVMAVGGVVVLTRRPRRGST
jgi:hypothetical protein